MPSSQDWRYLIARLIACSLSRRKSGGESGIRTLPRPIASITYRFYIATDAKFTTLAAHHCTLLHAGKIRYLSEP